MTMFAPTLLRERIKEEEPPTCFAKQWDPNHPECTGGLDPQYTHPRTGTHVRETCEFFERCGAETKISRQNRLSSGLVPASALVRQQQPAAPQTFRAYMQTQQYAQQQPAASFMQSAPARPTFPQPYAAQPQPQQQLQYPAPAYQLQYLMPGYLTVPEQRTVGGSIWRLLGREVIRAIAKAMGHTVANFFDTNPLRLPPGQGGGERRE